MRSRPTRVLCVISILFGFLGGSASAADYAYVLSRGSTPILRGYKIGEDGSISSFLSTAFPSSIADTAPSERRVIGYASREKTLLVGLVDRLVVYKVEANGSLTPSSTPSIDFPGTRIEAVEVVEVGSKTFVYLGEGLGMGGAVYGYRVFSDASVVGIAGFPVAMQNATTDLASDGKHLYSAQPSNNSVYIHDIAADGTLTTLSSARPESRCSQIDMSPNGNVLISNADELSYVQQFEYFKKSNGFAYAGLFPVKATYTQPTVISVGKKYVAVARHAADVYSDVRLFAIDAAGRVRVVSPFGSVSGMTSINSIALIQNDGLLLAISDTDDALESFATGKKSGTLNSAAIDSEPIPGLAGVTTMLAIQR